MALKSILFGKTDYVPEPYPKEPEFFRDLSLDYVIEGIVFNAVSEVERTIKVLSR